MSSHRRRIKPAKKQQSTNNFNHQANLKPRPTPVPQYWSRDGNKKWNCQEDGNRSKGGIDDIKYRAKFQVK